MTPLLGIQQPSLLMTIASERWRHQALATRVEAVATRNSVCSSQEQVARKEWQIAQSASSWSTSLSPFFETAAAGQFAGEPVILANCQLRATRYRPIASGRSLPEIGYLARKSFAASSKVTNRTPSCPDQ
jgi:hypothetical protein